MESTKGEGRREWATPRNGGVGVDVPGTMKVSLGGLGIGAKATNLATEGTPMVTCSEGPCEGPAVKDAAMAAPIHDVIALKGPLGRAVGALVILLEWVGKTVNQGRKTTVCWGLRREFNWVVVRVWGWTGRGVVSRRAEGGRPNRGCRLSEWSHPGELGL